MFAGSLQIVADENNVDVPKNLERFTNLRVILAQGPC